ncbi:MAG: hypothetical protein KAT10_04730 [Sulfurimonas sp.]|nr:hypothetical protein [Sulfurimonas sp.]
MLKVVKLGETSFSEIHQLFKLPSHEEFQKREARLFPSGNADNEVSTTSIFLASLSAVKEYREELFTSIGINKIKTRNVQLHVYTELYNSDNGDRPDGLIVITSGKSNPIVEWMCFVEAKVKDNLINKEQIGKYSDFARDIGINAIITISNYLVTTPFDSPVKLKKRSFDLYHWSWTYLKVVASRLIKTDSIEDEDHVYILKELRRYFDAHKNLSNFTNMGKEWKDSVGKIHSLSIDKKIDTDTLHNIVESYKQEEKDISLQLTDKSGHMVELVSKNDRVEELANMLNGCKIITSQFFINGDKKHCFYIDIDFHAQSIKCYTTVSISKGKAQAQTSTLIKMFEGDAGYMDRIMVNAFYNRKKSLNNDISLLQLSTEKNNAEPYSILDKDFGDEVKSFEIKTFDSLGKNFQATQSFISKLEDISYRFLTQVMENIK